jgi:hypothetical protein
MATGYPFEEINPYAEKWTTANVPLWLLQHGEVSAGAKLLYGRLMLYAGKSGRAYPNQATLASDLDISTRQVRRYVQELEDHHLIEGKKRMFADSNHYIFRRHPWQQGPLANSGMPVRRGGDTRNDS